MIFLMYIRSSWTDGSPRIGWTKRTKGQHRCVVFIVLSVDIEKLKLDRGSLLSGQGNQVQKDHQARGVEMDRWAPLEWLDYLVLDRKVNNKTRKNTLKWLGGNLHFIALTFGLTGSQGEPGRPGLPGVAGPIGLKGKYQKNKKKTLKGI